MTWHNDTRQLPPGASPEALADLAAQVGSLNETGQAAAFAQAQAAAETLVSEGLIDATEFAAAAVRIHTRLLAQLVGRQLEGLSG